uniref:NADH-ubiquinone oxidoreductase chain 2 n=1 Tax=Ectoneura hanitschi TaxID=2093485 RepID=A0A2P1H9D9_9NEOP|nr:NADH dehydrogenase subunit 2 [Ectoneura hanitschi]
MSKNSTKVLFLLTLLSGVLITISSNSWMGAWMGLEINLLSFIPIMSNSMNILTSESSLKYFLIQSLASITLLFLIFSKSFMEIMFNILNSPTSSNILLAPLLMKSGIPPFHWWFPGVMEGLSWMNCFILMSIQKIAPLTLINHFLSFNSLTIIIISLSIAIGAIGGLNQISIRKIMTYSSINHIGWMMSSMILGNHLWFLYFFLYSFLTLTIIKIMNMYQLSFINQINLTFNNNFILKFIFFSSMLSLGGLPPFLGFFPKWIIIQMLTFNNMFILVLFMVIFSLITLFYYLRMTYSSFMMLNSNINWIFLKNNKNYFIISILNMFSLIGLTLCSFTTNLY